MINLQRLLRKVTRGTDKVPSRPVILMYHRVAEVNSDPWDLAVRPDLFADQMSYLRRYRCVMPMEEFAACFRTKTLPKNAVAITFDDGYLDNLLSAKPILTAHQCPATVFVATGYVGCGNPFWWDELGQMILESDESSDYELAFQKERVRLVWDHPERDDIENVWRGWQEPRTNRQRSYLGVWRRLKLLSLSDRNSALATLRAHFGSASNDGSRPMNRTELGQLQEGGLLSIGAHTVTHPSLIALPAELCRSEITESGHTCLELSRKSGGFAYPYGDLNQSVMQAVEEAGFAWACATTRTEVNYDRSDPYAFPRFAATNIPARQLFG